MRLFIVVVIAATLAAPSWAQTTSTDHAAHHPPEATVAQPLVEGEVRKVDKEAGKLTLKHGPIANLDMPEMTMVFRVKDSTILNRVKVGDKVKFSADKVNGVLTVTSLEAVK